MQGRSRAHRSIVNLGGSGRKNSRSELARRRDELGRACHELPESDLERTVFNLDGAAKAFDQAHGDRRAEIA
jgi:hypothetical protein